jgi:hypothetical protein
MPEKNINIHTIEYFLTFLSSHNIVWLLCVIGDERNKYFQIIMTFLKFQTLNVSV